MPALRKYEYEKKEELEEINKTRQQNGLKPRTMDDYQ